MGSRRKSREAALKILYAVDVSGQTAEQALAAYFEHFAEEGEEREFAAELVRGVGTELERLDAAIRTASQNWRLERMARVDRNILRLATYELLYVAEIPPLVTINEAIDMAKKYSTKKSGHFVNGILDHIRTTVAPEAKRGPA